jgi:hypothetical protein
MKWSETVPVIISVAVIILVAVLEKQSKLVAALTASMPLTMPLTLWIVYASNKGERLAVEQFTRGLVVGIIATVAFVLAIWLAARAGLKLAPMIAVGYAAWGIVLVALIWIQRFLGS